MGIAVEPDGHYLWISYRDRWTVGDVHTLAEATRDYLDSDARFAIVMSTPLPDERDPGTIREFMQWARSNFEPLRRCCAGLAFPVTPEQQARADRTADGPKFGDHMPFPMRPFRTVADALAWAEELLGEPAGDR